MRIGVYIAGRKCPKFARQCLESLRAQTFGGWIACVTVDGEDDKITFDACASAAGDDNRILINWMKRGHSCRAKLASITALVDGLGQLDDTDILVGLDLDDRLQPDALQTIHDAHAKGAWVTYGNWLDQDAKVHKIRFLTPGLMEHIRDVPFFLTAPNTFRVGLFRKVPDTAFRWNDDRGYYEAGFDSCVMYSVADLADVGKITMIRKPIYVYNRNHSRNVIRAWPSEYRTKAADEKRGKPRLQRVESLTVRKSQFPVPSMADGEITKKGVRS